MKNSVLEGALRVAPISLIGDDFLSSVLIGTHGNDNLIVSDPVGRVAARRGADEVTADAPIVLAALGRGELAGTKVISLSGDVLRPGNYEVPFGFPLQTLLHDWAGGPGAGRTIQAVTMAGISGGFLAGDDLDVSLDEPSVRAKGSMLGAAGIIKANFTGGEPLLRADTPLMMRRAVAAATPCDCVHLSVETESVPCCVCVFKPQLDVRRRSRAC